MEKIAHIVMSNSDLCPHRSKGFMSAPSTCLYGARRTTPYDFKCLSGAIPDHCQLPTIISAKSVCVICNNMLTGNPLVIWYAENNKHPLAVKKEGLFSVNRETNIKSDACELGPLCDVCFDTEMRNR